MSSSCAECCGANSKRVKLHNAAANGHAECLDAAIRANKSPDALLAPDERGLAPLHVAAANGHAALCEALVRAGAPHSAPAAAPSASAASASSSSSAASASSPP